MKRSAKWSLVFGFVALILSASTLIIVSSSVTSEAVLGKHVHTIMENIASYTIDKAESHLAPAPDAARLTLGLSKNNIVNNRDIDSMLAYFYEQLYISKQFSSIYLGTVDGEFIMASRSNELVQGGFLSKIIRVEDGKRTVTRVYRNADGHFMKTVTDIGDLYDPRKRPWFTKALAENKLIWTSPYIFYTSRKPGITTANPVYGLDSSLVGVIGVDIEIDELSSFISRLRVSDNGRAFIVNRTGELIAYPDIAKLRHKDLNTVRLTTISELEDPISREAFLSLGISPTNLQLDASKYTSFEYDGQKYSALFAPFENDQWPWLIGIYMPFPKYPCIAAGPDSNESRATTPLRPVWRSSAYVFHDSSVPETPSSPHLRIPPFPSPPEAFSEREALWLRQYKPRTG